MEALFVLPMAVAGHRILSPENYFLASKGNYFVSKFRFWATLITASVLGIAGYIIGGLLPIAQTDAELQARIICALSGVLLGLLSFAKVSSWVVQSTTRLLKQLISRIADEVASRYTQISTRTKKPDFEGLDKVRKGILGNSIVLDTSSIIDGRILDVAKTGFLSGLVIIPAFVLTELREVSDSADALKRNRGRRGFKVVDDLKKIPNLKVEIWEESLALNQEKVDVDDKLIWLTRLIKGRLLTCDFNLNREANTKGVRVLNLNDLSNSLKTLPVPGEKLQLKILQNGKERDQGVGYLPDGTMIVVKDGAGKLNQEIAVEVIKIIQGPSGRMVFAVPAIPA